MNKRQAKIKEVLERGVENIYPSKTALEKVLQSNKKLKIYLGIDATGKLHIGHGVPLTKLRQLQDLGHQVIVLIGDFTAMVGDPTDKAAVRKPLTEKQVQQNLRDYRKLIAKILDPKKTTFERNSKWLKKMSFADVLALSSNFTVQQLLERDMFEKRMAEGKPVHLHEFLYPVMVGYDCVALDVDMEIGGSDQTFNILAGRTLMKAVTGKEKFVLTTGLLTDPTGKKMGKSEGNMVNLDDEPNDMYGKVMSWPDTVIVTGFELATSVTMEELEQIKKDFTAGTHPKRLKMLLAYKLVERYHGKKAAISAEENFKEVFEQKLNPDEMPICKTNSKNIVDVLVETKLASSKSEARRLIAQGGIKVDTLVVKDEQYQISLDADGVVIQKGKRHFVKVVK